MSAVCRIVNCTWPFSGGVGVGSAHPATISPAAVAAPATTKRAAWRRSMKSGYARKPGLVAASEMFGERAAALELTADRHRAGTHADLDVGQARGPRHRPRPQHEEDDARRRRRAPHGEPRDLRDAQRRRAGRLRAEQEEGGHSAHPEPRRADAHEDRT